jgi:hypothetical protein
VLKSLTYFEDAEREPMPRMLEPFDWQECRAFFVREATRSCSRDHEVVVRRLAQVPFRPLSTSSIMERSISGPTAGVLRTGQAEFARRTEGPQEVGAIDDRSNAQTAGVVRELFIETAVESSRRGGVWLELMLGLWSPSE